MVSRKPDMRYQVDLDMTKEEKKVFHCLYLNGFEPSRAESYIEWRREGLSGKSLGEIGFFCAVEQDIAWRMKQLGWS